MGIFAPLWSVLMQAKRREKKKKKEKEVCFHPCYTRIIAGEIAILENLHAENVYPQKVNTKILSIFS